MDDLRTKLRDIIYPLIGYSQTIHETLDKLEDLINNLGKKATGPTLRNWHRERFGTYYKVKDTYTPAHRSKIKGGE